MRSIFEDRQVSIKCDDKYSYTVTKDGLAYVPGNGKTEVKVLFSEVGSTFLLNYCSSNGPYEITFRITTAIISLALTQTLSFVDLDTTS